MDPLAQGGVRMHGVKDVLLRGFKGTCQDQLVNHFSGAVPNEVRTEYFPIFITKENFHESRGFMGSNGLPAHTEGEATDLVRCTGLLERIFCFAHTRNFGLAVGAPGNGLIGDIGALMACDLYVLSPSSSLLTDLCLEEESGRQKRGAWE